MIALSKALKLAINETVKAIVKAALDETKPYAERRADIRELDSIHFELRDAKKLIEKFN